MLFLSKLAQNCETYGNKTAVLFLSTNGEHEQLSYQTLQDHVEQTAHYLQALGVNSGDCVAVRLPKCLPFLLLNLAIMRLGAFVLPLNPAYPQRELTYFLNNSKAVLFFTDQPLKGAEKLVTKTVYLSNLKTAVFLSTITPTPETVSLPTLPIEPEQPALMIYTSGTTGQPKGALIPHRNLEANLNGLHTAWGWEADDKLLHVLPIFHYHGLVVALYGALYAGATAVLTEKFNAEETLSLLESEQCTVLMGVPSIHKRLVDVPRENIYDLRHVRLITSGSDRLPDDLFNTFKNRFGHTLLERYGMTETGLTLSNPLHGERRIGSVGFPLPNAELRIADSETNEPLPDGEIGELQMRGPHLFSGYWRLPEKTAVSYTSDGWFKTGDLALREPDGYFSLKGRNKDLIITGGLNVYPPEVELILADLPQVQASAVIGCPDDDWGERVTAVLVLKPNQSLTAHEVIDYCRHHLAPYKTPKTVHFVDSLPANALGKVQKAKLRTLVCKA